VKLTLQLTLLVQPVSLQFRDCGAQYQTWRRRWPLALLPHQIDDILQRHLVERPR
jgi:hypothetical protein